MYKADSRIRKAKSARGQPKQIKHMHFPTQGQTHPQFEPVREVFQANFTEDADVGASFAVVRNGELIVDLWGGYLDRDCTTPWTERSLVNLYSTTKGLAALAIAWVVEHTDLGYEDEVLRYWPELKAARDGLTVGQLLSHQGGLCGVDTPVTVEDLYDWSRMTELLADQEPHWPPGTAAGYHAIVWGYLGGELVRRITGRTLGEVFREEIAAPLDADCYIGLPEALHGNVADMIGPNHARIQPDLAALMSMEMPELYGVALQNPSIRPYHDASSAAWRNAEIAAANGQGNARGIARIYGSVACGDEMLLKRNTVDALVREEVAGQSDLVLGRALRRGRGVILNTDNEYGPNASSFGHSGAGGSVGFADPEAVLGGAFAMNQMQMNLNDDTRMGRLVRVTYECLANG